jgi:hypothetical protein
MVSHLVTNLIERLLQDWSKAYIDKIGT